MEFRVLGPLVVEHAGRPVPVAGQRERCLLGVLLLSAGRVVSTDRLVDCLWAERAPAHAHAAIHTYVSRLRRALACDDLREPAARVLRRGSGYLIEVDPAAVDLHRFDRLVEQARERADPDGRSQVLHEALALWRGPMLADIGTPELRARLSASANERRLAALRMRLEADLDLGRHREIIGELVELCDEHPLDEELASTLIVALYRSGRRHDALAAYNTIRTQLRHNLGLDPGQNLRALEVAVLRGSGQASASRTPGCQSRRRLPHDRIRIHSSRMTLAAPTAPPAR